MIKIIKLSFYYEEYLKYYYRNNNIDNVEYEKHQKKIFENRFGWSDSFKETLNQKENFQVEEIIVNDYALQIKWSKENKINFDKENWQFQILKEQIKYYKPDIIFINNPALEKKYYELFLSFNSKIISYDGICAHNTNILNYSNLIVTCLKNSCEFYKKNNKNVYYMPHGFDNRIINIVKKNQNSLHDVVFIGNIRNINHSNRISLLSKLLSKTDIKIWIGDANKKINKKNIKNFTSLRNYFLNFNYFKNYFRINNIVKKNSGQVFGKEMYQLISDSKVILNNHIDISQNEMANIRLFECTGLGTCLLTDYKDNMVEFFNSDEIVTYKTHNEALSKIKFLRNNPTELKKIAEKGQIKTLSEHTIQKRWEKFSNYLLDFEI